MPEVLEGQNPPLAGVGDPDDIYRSLRRYVALMLGSPPWKVRLQRSRVADDDRPVAILEPGVLTTPHSRARTVNQGDVQKMQPFTVVCYPAFVGPDHGGTAVAAAETARQVAYLLDAGFSRGLVTDDVPPVSIGAPWAVPVYSFAGVPVEGPGRAGATNPYMHADIDQTFNVRAVQDPMDELRYTVIANLRLTWWAAGRIPPAAPIATTMPGMWEADAP